MTDSDAVRADKAVPARRRTAIIASSVVTALVVTSMVWGGVTAAQAVATERRLEAQRVVTLGHLLDDRSTASELAATTAGVLGTAGDSTSPVPEAHGAVTAAHAELTAELARLLDRETSSSMIVAQSRLLEGDVRVLIARLDEHTRAIVDHGRAARAAAPLASKASLATLDAAITSLAVVPQGLPTSYSGRASLVADVLAATSAATASHAAAKAEQARKKAEREAAEAAAARRAGPPATVVVTLYLLCGYDEFDEPVFCPYPVTMNQ